MISRALIPVAGRGTRMLPLTSVVPKALLGLVDGAGRMKSVLHVICDEAIAAGVGQIGVVVSPWQEQMVRDYFVAAESEFGEFGAAIEYIVQGEPKGFGDAVLQCRDFVGDEAFLLLLGDHIHVADDGEPACGFQVVEAFGRSEAVTMVGVQPVPEDELSKVGAACGDLIGQDVYRCRCFIEKPDPAVARSQLVTAGLGDNTYLGHCGIYVFTGEIFECIEQAGAIARQAGKEVELADAQSLFLEKYPERYYLYKIAGEAYDLGTPCGYADAVSVFRNRC
jgi:UTP--glucose-1-phosphate uridylyltransferase